MFQLRGLEALAEAKDREAAAVYCGGKFGVTDPNFQPCVDFYASDQTGDYAPTTTGKASKLPAFAMNLVNANKISATHQTAEPSVMSTLMPSNVPWYKTPLGIGAIVLVAFLGYRQLGR